MTDETNTTSTILVKTVRVYGLRGLENIQVSLEPTTVLTGMNNTGKTSFLKALQITFGTKNFLTHDDFHICNDTAVDKIIVDVNIIAVDGDGKRLDSFSSDWETVFTESRFKFDTSGKAHVPIRTVMKYDPLTGNFKSKQFVLKEWSEFKNKTGEFWYQLDDGDKTTFNLEELFFVYTDAQRDLLEDLKVRNSSLGKMLSKISYSEADIKVIETAIDDLNKKAVNSSDILSDIETTLKGLDSAMDNTASGVQISPFAKKIRDLNKGVSIQYSDFSMEYHGMGTRSWSSLLTLKSFVELLGKNAVKESKSFFPIIAIEEPEAHLHPNAQKKIYSQMTSISGQKIISTHSPYIAASARLNQVRSFYKSGTNVISGEIDTATLSNEDIRKINRQVVNTRGELFFSKAIVFFEGETEEQALPIFAKKYFDVDLLEMGIDFVGVGGCGNYYPFINLARSLNIPWFIFSDGEVKVIKKIKKDLQKLYEIDDVNIEEQENIIILPDALDFEKYLIESDYTDEIVSALELLHTNGYVASEIAKRDGTNGKRIKTQEICHTCQQSIYQNLIKDYSGDEGFKCALYDLTTSQKTQFGSVIADVIINSNKDLPPLVTTLFSKLKSAL